jgi:hypothetical protein
VIILSWLRKRRNGRLRDRAQYLGNAARASLLRSSVAHYPPAGSAHIPTRYENINVGQTEGLRYTPDGRIIEEARIPEMEEPRNHGRNEASTGQEAHEVA